MQNRPAALIILDGFGNNPNTKYNAIAASGIPNIKKLLSKYPNATLKTSGLSVGLPFGNMGNSEVGHLNIGAGRIVYQDLTAIDKAIGDGEFFENKVLIQAMDNCLQNKSSLHLMGLLSDGGVHSHIQHLYALLKMAKQKGVKSVFVHAIMDGRDVPPKSGQSFLDALQQQIEKIGIGKIATVIGRYYIMDRDNRWERVSLGYGAVMDGKGKKFDNAELAIKDARKNNLTDEFVEASVIGDYNGVQQNDSIIFFNFRADRAREISRAILYSDFDKLERVGGYKKVFYVGMTEYDATFEDIHTAFAPKDIKGTLGEVLSKNGLRQVRIAETEKYAHVTFFFNGGVEKPNEGESRILVPSPKVATYDIQPRMSALEVTDECINALDETDVLIVNFANCDMVGHTGVVSAAIKAVDTVDSCVAKIVDAILELDGCAIITADHGNCECMAYDNGSPMTSHTTFDVPIIVVGKNFVGKKLQNGALCDIAPTLLHMIGVQPSKEMTGKNLLE